MRFGGEYDGEDCWLVWGRWDANVKATLNGRPGLAALKRLEAALVALPTKRLIMSSIVRDGDVCALGALELHERGGDLAALEEAYGYLWDDDGSMVEDASIEIGKRYGMSMTLATHVAATNDEDWHRHSPEERYTWMLSLVRRWISESRATTGRPAGRD